MRKREDGDGLVSLVAVAAVLLVLTAMYIALHVQPVRGAEPSRKAAELNRSDRKATRIIMFTGPGCAPCEQAKRDIVPRLKKLGWQVDEIDTSLLPKLTDSFGVTVIPTFVVVRSRVEVQRTTGAKMPVTKGP